MGRRQRDAKDGVRAELALVRSPVEGDQRRVETRLIRGVCAEKLGGNDLADVGDGLEDALAAVLGLVAIAQLDRFVGPGGCARRDAGAPDRTIDQDDVDLDGRVAARIEDLSGFDGLDAGH